MVRKAAVFSNISRKNSFASTVKPWDAHCLGNRKTRVVQNSCNLSYLIRQEHQKLCSVIFSLHNFVHLKFFLDPIQKCVLSVSAAQSSVMFLLHNFVHLKFFRPYSKTCNVKVCAAQDRVSRGLTVSEKNLVKTHLFFKVAPYCWFWMQRIYKNWPEFSLPRREP